MRSLNTLGVTVGIVIMIMQPSQSWQQCQRSPQKNYGCSFNYFSSDNAWCKVDSFKDPNFLFYVRPGDQFNKLLIKVNTDFWRVVPTDPVSFEIDQNLLPLPDKWYHVQFWSRTEGFMTRHYYLSIDGVMKMDTTMTWRKASEFIVLTSGSIFHSDHCNPEGYTPTPSTSTSQAPPSPRSISPTSLPSSPEARPVPSSTLSVYVIITISAVGVAVIATVALVIVVIKVMNQKRKRRTGRSRMDDSNEDNSHKDQVAPPSYLNDCTDGNIYDTFEDISLHNYEVPKGNIDDEPIYEDMDGYVNPTIYNAITEPTDDNPEEHIYEEIDDYACSTIDIKPTTSRRN